MTVANHLARLKAYAMTYKQQIRLQDQVLIKCIERARDDVTLAMFSIQEALFRKATTLADGDPLPTDYVIGVPRIYRESGGVRTPFTYIDVGIIADATVNPLLKAVSVTQSPVWYIADQKFKTLPTASGVTFQYYAKKQALAVDPPNLTLDDQMPVDAVDAITAGAFEYALNILEEEGATLSITRVQRDEALASRQISYARVDNESLSPTRER